MKIIKTNIQSVAGPYLFIHSDVYAGHSFHPLVQHATYNPSTVIDVNSRIQIRLLECDISILIFHYTCPEGSSSKTLPNLRGLLDAATVLTKNCPILSHFRAVTMLTFENTAVLFNK